MTGSTTRTTNGAMIRSSAPAAGMATSPAIRPGAPSAARPPGPQGPRPESVTFRLFASARVAAGTAEFHIEPGSTNQVVAALKAALPPRFAEVLASSSLLADGVRLDHASTTLIPGGTTVDVLPPFAGG